MTATLRTLAAMAALTSLSGGYGHGRRLEVEPEEDQPAKRYMAADWGATPAVTLTAADVQRLAAAQAKRARKAAKRKADAP